MHTTTLDLFIAIVEYDETEMFAQTFLSADDAEAAIDDFIRTEWEARYLAGTADAPCPSGVSGNELRYPWYDLVGGSIVVMPDSLILPERN